MKAKVSKFTGSAEMDVALDRMVAAVNDGFNGGKVTKHDLVSWVTLHFEAQYFQGCLDKIRQDHFDQVAYLESVLRQAKQARRSGAQMPDLSGLLSPLSKQDRPQPMKRRGVSATETTKTTELFPGAKADKPTATT